jgi:hypothetical protein
MPRHPPGAGSIIVVVATDAPLLPSLKRRTACANGAEPHRHGWRPLFRRYLLAFQLPTLRLPTTGLTGDQMLANDELDPFFAFVAYAGKSSDQRTGRRTHDDRERRTMHAIPHERLLKILKQHHGTTLKDKFMERMLTKRHCAADHYFICIHNGLVCLCSIWQYGDVADGGCVGTWGFGGDNGPARQAKFAGLQQISFGLMAAYIAEVPTPASVK